MECYARHGGGKCAGELAVESAMEEIEATSVRRGSAASINAAHAKVNAILRRVKDSDDAGGYIGVHDEEKMLESCDDEEADILESLVSKVKLCGVDGDVELTVRKLAHSFIHSFIYSVMQTTITMMYIFLSLLFSLSLNFSLSLYVCECVCVCVCLDAYALTMLDSNCLYVYIYSQEKEHAALSAAAARGAMSHLVRVWLPWWRAPPFTSRTNLRQQGHAHEEKTDVRLSATGTALITVVSDDAQRNDIGDVEHTEKADDDDEEEDGVIVGRSKPPSAPTFDLVSTASLMRSNSTATANTLEDSMRRDDFFTMRLIEVLHAYCATCVTFNGCDSGDDGVAMLLNLAPYLTTSSRAVSAALGNDRHSKTSCPMPPLPLDEKKMPQRDETMPSLCLELASRRARLEPTGSKTASDEAHTALHDTAEVLRRGGRVGALLALNDVRSMLVAWQQRHCRRVLKRDGSGRVVTKRVDIAPSWEVAKRRSGAEAPAATKSESESPSVKAVSAHDDSCRRTRGSNSKHAKSPRAAATDAVPITKEDEFLSIADARRKLEFMMCWCNERDDTVLDGVALSVSASASSKAFIISDAHEDKRTNESKDIVLPTRRQHV